MCGKKIKQPVALAVLFVLMFIGGCFFVKANQAKGFEKNDYGVFLNADASSLERFKMYETIVIDAQYFTKRDIELLHQKGTVVYLSLIHIYSESSYLKIPLVPTIRVPRAIQPLRLLRAWIGVYPSATSLSR